MAEQLLGYLVQYGGYLLEATLLGYVLLRHQSKRLMGVCLYLGLLLAADGIGRPFVLNRYGLASHQYAYFYWLTDVILALGAFLLVCALFRRACREEEKMWRFLRPMLFMTFILVLGISIFSLSRNYDHIFSRFITEFEQNLYFTCLVLNTLLYILIQQTQNADDELSLLVTGLGIQFAGPAANFALLYLTPGQEYARSLLAYVEPLCYVGMLVTWSYALMRAPKRAKLPEQAPAWAGSALGS
jgi:hypothetical protein